jgi:hypothetical protein
MVDNGSEATVDALSDGGSMGSRGPRTDRHSEFHISPLILRVIYPVEIQ